MPSPTLSATVQQTGSLMVIVSISQPVLPELLSLPNRHLSWIFCPAALAGRFAAVVMNPKEFPLQALRPPMGFPQQALSVALYPPSVNVPPAATMSAYEPLPILISKRSEEHTSELQSL